MRKTLDEFSRLRGMCGAPVAATLLLRRARRLPAAMSFTPLPFSGLNFPRLELRPTDSDMDVALQIFQSRDYELPGPVKAGLNARADACRARGQTPVVIDGGANTGYSSVYFAEAYPSAIVCAVEPNAATFDVLTRNAAYCDRIKPTYGALWEDRGGVDLDLPPNGAWAARTLALDDAEVTDRPKTRVPSLTLADLIATAPNAYPLIIKLDIEGAERVVCAAAQDVLRQAACIIIEPHDWMRPGQGCLAPLFTAVAGREMDTFLMGENLVLAETALGSGGPAAGDR